MIRVINGGDNMYSIAICEDEQIQTKQLVDVLRRYEKENSIQMKIITFESAESFIQYSSEPYHLVFLDIGLPGLDGIHLAKKIREASTQTQIAFLTAHEKYWPEGYKVLASRFLLKPITSMKLYEEIESLMNDLNKRNQYVLVSKEKDLAKVIIDEILYLEISGRKVLIHTVDGIYNSSDSLRYWVQKLSSYYFVQAHSSYLVNLKYVKLVERDCAILTTGHQVYISLRKYKHFKESFIRYVSQI